MTITFNYNGCKQTLVRDLPYIHALIHAIFNQRGEPLTEFWSILDIEICRHDLILMDQKNHDESHCSIDLFYFASKCGSEYYSTVQRRIHSFIN